MTQRVPICGVRCIQLLKQADFDYQRRQYNTVVSACMKMLNTLEAAPDFGECGSTI